MNLKKLKTAKTPLGRLRINLGLESVSAIVLLIFLGKFISQHFSEPRFAWPAVLMDVWTIAILGASIRQLLLISAIHYDGPVLDIQKRMETLRLFRFRVIRFALITGLLVWWLPFLVVSAKALFNIDAYRLFGERYFYVNALTLGLVAPLLFWLSKSLSPKMAGHFEGNFVVAALASIAAISEFEGTLEEPDRATG